MSTVERVEDALAYLRREMGFSIPELDSKGGFWFARPDLRLAGHVEWQYRDQEAIISEAKMRGWNPVSTEERES